MATDVGTDDVAQVRQFHRLVMQRAGVLDDRFLGRDRPMGESRLLYEIGPEGSDLRDLRRRLGLDSGYVSRLIQALQRKGLIRLSKGSGDQRVRQARWTAAGRREVRELNTRSDEATAALLEKLPPDRRFENGFDPGASLPADDHDLVPPSGAFLVASVDGQTVAGCAVKTISPGIGSLKRMWVDDSMRGLGIGRRMLEESEAQARNLGITTLRLETNHTLQEAVRLYLSAGYREVAPHSIDPYAHHWFEKTLG